LGGLRPQGPLSAVQTMSRPAILYLSYDGMLEPLGQSQVLAYLERLTDRYEIDLVSFEKKGDWADAAARDRVRRRIAAARIGWTALAITRRRRPPPRPMTLPSARSSPPAGRFAAGPRSFTRAATSPG
jgi:hypothetical protein